MNLQESNGLRYGARLNDLTEVSFNTTSNLYVGGSSPQDIGSDAVNNTSVGTGALNSIIQVQHLMKQIIYLGI